MHIPISSASCAPVWNWQRATGPFPLGELNAYGCEVPAPRTPLSAVLVCILAFCWNFWLLVACVLTYSFSVSDHCKMSVFGRFMSSVNKNMSQVIVQIICIVLH